MYIKQLDHLNMTVRSLDDTADWYRRVLGFEMVEKGVSQGRHFAVLKAGDAMLCIYEAPEFTRRPDHASQAESLAFGVRHLALRIADGDAWRRAIERERLTIHHGPIRYPHSTSWYVFDPTGFEIEIVLWDDDTPSFD